MRSPYLTDLEIVLGHLDMALGHRDALVKVLQATQGQIINANIDLRTGHTKAQVIQKMEGIIRFVDNALSSIKEAV